MMNRVIQKIASLLTVAIVSLLCGLTASGAGFTVVIDPGHGGKDYGAVGEFANEKTINLGVALKLGKLIKDNMPDVKVVYTRDKDVFISLQKRADIANAANADLFISIHANSVAKDSPKRNTVCGASVYTLGIERSATNLEIAKRENSVIMLEPDYSTTYHGFNPNSTESYIMFEMFQSAHIDKSIRFASLVQNQLVKTAGRRNSGVRQAPFYVLVRTAMPSVLVELDFICNPVQEKFMASEAGQNKLAASIYNGLREYRNNKGKALTTVIEQEEKVDEAPPVRQPKVPVNNTPQPATTTATDNTLYYKVQFLTSGSLLSPTDQRMKGMTDVEHYTDGKIIKYTVGNGITSIDEAKKLLNQVRQKFPQAFIIKWRSGARVD